MKNISPPCLLLVVLFFATNIQSRSEETIRQRLDNPMSIDYLQQNLDKQTPRLFLNTEKSIALKEKIASDPIAGAFYQTLRADAFKIANEPLLVREIYDGRRMLPISREMIRRMGILGIVYHIENDPRILNRIDEELKAVCYFSDWNPSHFLDVGEMALGVALALDWTGKALPERTSAMAINALINKALLPGLDPNHDRWKSLDNNWNQVCHGGLIAAAIAVADIEPGLAVKILDRALNNMHFALGVYGPDGVYPEGATYWGYGTAYSLLTASMFESAFGTDFGVTSFPGFMESAEFVMLMTAPSGEYFDFYDTQSNLRYGSRGEGNIKLARFNNPEIAVNLTWFAAKTGNMTFFDPSYFTDNKDDRRKSRFDGIAMVWLSEMKGGDLRELPLNWMGNGKNPVAVFWGGESDPNKFYLGTKGGRASISHGHMDAGSFVFELDGVRWSVDPGIQEYAPLEQAGFNQWNMWPNSDRWKLLTKGSHGHSTLTVNGRQHYVNGTASILEFNEGTDEPPFVSYDLTPLFEGYLRNARRIFTIEGPRSVNIEDHLVINGFTEYIKWQMITSAEVIPTSGGARLRLHGKELLLEILSPDNINISVIYLDPPPIKLDKRINNLKRIEINVPAWILEDDRGTIKVRLTGN